MRLTYRGRGESKSGTIWDVLGGSLIICRIRKQVLSIDAKGAEQWNWTFQVSAKPEGFMIHGSGDSLEDAKRASKSIGTTGLSPPASLSADY